MCISGLFCSYLCYANPYVSSFIFSCNSLFTRASIHLWFNQYLSLIIYLHSNLKSYTVQAPFLIKYLFRSIINIEAGVESEFYKDEFETNHRKNFKFEVPGNKWLLSGFCSFKHNFLEDNASIMKFNMMYSSLLAEPGSATVDQEFLTSAANWEGKSIQDICARRPEADYICWLINKHFGPKARLRQISVLVDITQKKREICAITSINAGKSLVYQAILVMTGVSVLVISPTIALMEDQIRTSSLYYLQIWY